MIRALVSLKNLTVFDAISYAKPDAVIDQPLVEAVVDAPFPEATGIKFEYLPLNRKFVDQVPLNEVQIFAINKSISDLSANLSDAPVFNTNPIRSITAQALDQFSATVIFNRSFSDSASFTESVIRDVSRESSDSVGLADDSQVLTVIARPQDFVNSTDDFLGAQNVDDDQYMHFTKVTNRSVSLGDEEIKSLSIQRPDLPASLSDTHISSVGKDAGTDSASFSDQVDEKNTNLFILEKFNSTSAYSGYIENNYYSYQRPLGYDDADAYLRSAFTTFSVPTALADEAEFDVTHDENITASATDSDGKHIVIQRLEPNPYPYSNNHLQNSWRSIESSYYARVAANGYDGSLGNIWFPADNTGPYQGYLQYVYGIFDPQYVFYFAEDEHVITVSKAESETIALSEIDTRAVTKAESDQIATTTDSDVRSVTKVEFDTITTTDDLDGQAGVDDDQYMHFYKLRTNIAGLQDQAVLTPTKDISDTASFSDSGSILAQGYTVGMTYFSSDYVGTSGSF